MGEILGGQASEEVPLNTLLVKEVQAGQRKVNLIWERTQALIAILVTIAALTVVCLAAFLPVTGTVSVAAVVFITNLATHVIGTYFTRTNHTAIGGVGRKPKFEDYVGR